jgi:hypothetical protein
MTFVFQPEGLIEHSPRLSEAMPWVRDPQNSSAPKERERACFPGHSATAVGSRRKTDLFLLCEPLRSPRLCVDLKNHYAAAGEVAPVPLSRPGTDGGMVPLKLFHIRNGIDPITISANWLTTNASNQ